MILDSLLAFDTATLITANGTTQNSANVLDLHIINGGLPVLANLSGARDIGIGDDPALKLLVQVTVAATTGTSMTVSLEGATDNGSGAANAYSVWWVSPAYTTAQLVAGARRRHILCDLAHALVGLRQSLSDAARRLRHVVDKLEREFGRQIGHQVMVRSKPSKRHTATSSAIKSSHGAASASAAES